MKKKNIGKERAARARRGMKRYQREIKGKEISSMRRIMETRQEVRQKPIHPENFVRVKAPENFSLTENANEVISYFNQCESKIKSGNQVTFDLSEINNLTSDAIAFFVAHFNDPTFSMKKHLTAKAPNDDSIRERLNKSGFLKHVKSTVTENTGNNNFLLHKITNNRVENGIARDMAKVGSEYVFGEGHKVREVFEILIECMANTNNHASGDGDDIYDWWLVVNSSESSRKVNYTILDLGVGVFESSPMKRYKKDITQKVVKAITHNSFWVSDLLAGKIKSRTGLEQRGKGIPRIHKRSQSDKIKSPILVSNDVFVDLKTGEGRRLDSNFSGTLVHFELSED